MPNQLDQTKRRKSVSEHRAVIAALETIARVESATSMELLRQAIRQFIRVRVGDKETAEALRQTVLGYKPRMPRDFKTPAQVARFKRKQREFDKILIELGLISRIDVQQKNSVLAGKRKPRLVAGL